MHMARDHCETSATLVSVTSTHIVQKATIGSMPITHMKPASTRTAKRAMTWNQRSLTSVDDMWAYGDWRGAFGMEEEDGEKEEAGEEAEAGEETEAGACAESDEAGLHIVTTPSELETSEPQVLRF